MSSPDRRLFAWLRSTPLAIGVLASALLIAACGDASSRPPEAQEPPGERERATQAALATADTARADTAAGATPHTDMGDTAYVSPRAGATRLPPADSVTYDLYRNERFDFAVKYPANVVQPAAPVGEGNGRTFEAPGGTASIVAYATGPATRAKMRQRREEQKANGALDVTYEAGGRDWFILSGYRGDHIFYEHTDFRRDSTLITVRLFYDRTQKEYFDPIVRTVSRSIVRFPS